MLKDFDDLMNRIKQKLSKRCVAVAAAHEAHTMEAVLQAEREGVITPILVGDQRKIEEVLRQFGKDTNDYRIVATGTDAESAEMAVRLVHDGSAHFIMKGLLQTADLLRAVVNKENGLRTNNIMSAVALMKIPSYHKMILLTDGGMFMYPTLEEKKQIIENAVDVLHRMDYDNPKVAVLAAIENVNPKMPETVDADALKQMNREGQIPGCIVEGPISYDLTVNPESAKIKGYTSEVAGDADIFMVPNITVGNILSKSLIESAGAKSAGMIVGAQVPVVVTSRATTVEEKYLSLLVSAAASAER